MAWLICGILSAINAVLSLWMGDTANFHCSVTASPLQIICWKYIHHTTYTDFIGWLLTGMSVVVVCLNVCKLMGG